jgi:hypothetical protein
MSERLRRIRISREVTRIWAKIDGPLCGEMAKAVSFMAGSRRVLIPKSQLGRIEYAEGGDSTEIRIGAQVKAIEIPMWLAELRELD